MKTLVKQTMTSTKFRVSENELCNKIIGIRRIVWYSNYATGVFYTEMKLLKIKLRLCLHLKKNEELTLLKKMWLKLFD